MLTDTERLLNTIVILGAALVGGCGGSDDHPSSNKQNDDRLDAGTLHIDVKGDGGITDGGWTGW